MNYYKKIGELEDESCFSVELHNEFIIIKPNLVINNAYKKIINTKERLYNILEEDIFKKNSYYTISTMDNQIIIKKYEAKENDYFFKKKDLKKTVDEIFKHFKLKEFEYSPENIRPKIEYPKQFEDSKINYNVLKNTIKINNVEKNPKKEIENMLEDLERKYRFEESLRF